MGSHQKTNMDSIELLKKYQALLVENDRLREEIKSLNVRLSIEVAQETVQESFAYNSEQIGPEQEQQSCTIFKLSGNINKKSDSREKIKLFMSLFKGRDDVYAKRWENNKKGTSGYSPACGNEWKPGICLKPKISCTDCKDGKYLAYNEDVVKNHLLGQNNFVAGIYPLLINETCYFLAIDFDGEGWHEDITAIRETCTGFNIPIAVERSRSGNGAHAWFFFEHPIAASLARKFGSAILTNAMSERHEIKFKSYDRLFPNQDTMPKGGFGNLIALPLQKVARAPDIYLMTIYSH